MGSHKEKKKKKKEVFRNKIYPDKQNSFLDPRCTTSNTMLETTKYENYVGTFFVGKDISRQLGSFSINLCRVDLS